MLEETTVDLSATSNMIARAIVWRPFKTEVSRGILWIGIKIVLYGLNTRGLGVR